MVAAYIRTVFAQTTPDGVRVQLENVAATLAPRLPVVAAMLRKATSPSETQHPEDRVFSQVSALCDQNYDM